MYYIIRVSVGVPVREVFHFSGCVRTKFLTKKSSNQ